LGDCHYLEGNVQADKKIRATQKLLDLSGIGKQRLHLAWVSSAEAQRFVEIVTRVTASIKDQGKFDPAPLKLELDAAEMTLDGETARWMMSKQIKITSQGDIYGRKWDVGRYETILDSVIKREYHKNLIYLAMKQGLTSIEDVSHRTGLDLQLTSHLVSDLEKTGRVKFTGMTERIPAFATV
jgi:hypothetical protein